MADGGRFVLSIHPAFVNDGAWIDDFATPGSGYRFEKLLNAADHGSWHARGSVTPLREWLDHFSYALRALRRKPDAVVTNFPQLALAACFWKKLLRSKSRLVCWSMNIGSVQSGAKGYVAGLLLRGADVLVVHSTREISSYSRWLRLDPAVFRFVPLQLGEVRAAPVDMGPQPYVVALGSAQRDYASLIEAARTLPYRFVIIAKQSALAGLDLPANVEVMNGLSQQQCTDILGGARLSVVPVANDDTASGQVSFLNAMACRVPLVVTQCVGTTDYLSHEQDALLVPLRDAPGLAAAIRRLWDDPKLRQRLADRAYQTWQTRFSDPAAGRALVAVLDRVFVGPARKEADPVAP